MRITIRSLAFLFVLCFVVVGCKRSKTPRDVQVIGEIVPLSTVETQDSVAQWDDVFMPIRLTVYEPTEMSVSGRATMVKDQGIYFSLRVLGTEGAVGYVSADSIYLVDKYDKMYFAENLDSLMGDCRVGVHDIQKALVGQPFVPTHRLDSIAFATVWDECESTALQSLMLEVSPTTRVVCVYGSPIETPYGPFASTTDLVIDSDKGSLWVMVEWNVEEAKWNTGREIKFKSPKNNYQRLSFAQLVSALTQNE